VGRAKIQQNIVIPIEPERGSILTRNLRELATNIRLPSLYAVPRTMTKIEKMRLIPKITEILSLEDTFVKERLDRDKAFIWLKRHVSVDEVKQIEQLKSSSLGVTYEPRRFYPNGSVFAHTLGFCDVDNEGIAGLELLYNKSLKGKAGFRRTKRDAKGREIVALEEKVVPARNGSSLILSIDHHIQNATEEALTRAVDEWNAKGAVAIVMDPNNGDILAMSSRPSFDGNHHKAPDLEVRRNRAITDIFEPGSVFKIVTASAALNEEVVTLTSKFDCENGEWHALRGRTIHDVHPYGMLTFPEVLIKSSNIGTVKMAQKLGEKKLYEYIKKFGFGNPTRIDFPGEVNGIVRPVEKWSAYSITAIPFGQEVAATAIQMLRAISVLANGGRLVRPTLVKEIQDAQGVTLFESKVQISEPILQPEVVVHMSRILERVVNEGTGTRAQIEGIRVAGKTGTTQKLEGDGTYSHEHFVASFVGYAPAEKPLLAMIVVLDDPSPYYYGGRVAAPVFQEVIERSLPYLGYVPRSDQNRVSRVVVSRPETSTPNLSRAVSLP
jgi:cell division protein FtsI/penicillin-binding protein 2